MAKSRSRKKTTTRSKLVTVRSYRRKDGTRVHGYKRHTAR